MSLPVCPYCRTSVDAALEPATICPICGTAHHRDCWEENCGCTVFGCSAAPVEEAMVQVRPEDLSERANPQVAANLEGAASREAHESTGVPPPPALPSGFVQEAHGTFSPGPVDPIARVFSHPEVQPQSGIERSTYIWLAVLTGYVGAHNLYANRTTAGIIQLCTSLLSCLLLAPVVWIWAMVEAATVDRDGDGFLFR